GGSEQLGEGVSAAFPLFGSGVARRPLRGAVHAAPATRGDDPAVPGARHLRGLGGPPPPPRQPPRPGLPPLFPPRGVGGQAPKTWPWPCDSSPNATTSEHHKGLRRRSHMAKAPTAPRPGGQVTKWQPAPWLRSALKRPH